MAGLTLELREYWGRGWRLLKRKILKAFATVLPPTPTLYLEIEIAAEVVG